MATDWLTVGGGGGAGPASPADIMGWLRSPRHLLGGGGPDGGGGCEGGGATEDLDQGTSILVLGRAIWGEEVRT